MSLIDLAERCERATGADRELDAQIAATLRICSKEWKWADGYPAWEGRNDGRVYLENGGPSFSAPAYTASLDAAMSLVPATSCNLLIMQFGRGWRVTFHDTAQKMGARAATEQIERLRQSFGTGYQLAGEPARIMEKAIAEHWLEFHCPCAATPALALCAAALRARASLVQEERA